MARKKQGFTTRQIHCDGHDKAMNAHCQPIFQTSTFTFDSPEHGASLFAGEAEGHIYTRLGNPTTEALERLLAAIEDADRALVFASGMAAVLGATIPFLDTGDHMVAGETLYGCTSQLLAEKYPKRGVRCTFVDTSNPDEVRAAITPKTRLCFIETPANPTNAIADIASLATICRERDVRLIVDNTFATPYNQNPLNLGAHIVMHSGTKYLNGHGDIVAGCVMGTEADMFEINEYRSLTGPIISPFDSYLFLRGIKTLSMRMERHNANGMKVAEFLENHPDVNKVSYPGLPSHPGHKVAKKQMRGFSGMIAFELKGGFEAAKELMRHTKVFILAVSLGTLDSLIQHPASMTHSHVPKELLIQQGLTENLVRLSVGCEDIEDLTEDLEQAFAAVRATVHV